MNNGQRIPIDIPLLGQSGPPQNILGVQNLPGPGATPVTLPVQTPQGVIVRQIGGMTRLDHIAAAIAAEVFRNTELSEQDTPEQKVALVKFQAAKVVDFAAAVLEELNAHQWPKEKSQEPPAS